MGRNSEIHFKAAEVVTNTKRSPAAYIEVREDASTGFLPKLPLKTDFPFGIYIHWPFCLSKCPYCDFFSQVKKGVEQEEIIKGYLEDLDFYAEMTQERTVTSIFFGGGTPSLIKPQLIEKIITHISRKWQLSEKAEISLEANPNSDRPDLFKDLRSAGINRLSLGVQALNEPDLRLLGRTHSLKQAYQAIDEVLQTFDNQSIDLIYARPGQTLDQWQQEIGIAAGFGFKHLSMYQLTIEEGTFFYKKGIKAAEENLASEMYNFTNHYLNEHGCPQYEISNYAQPGFESRHNQLYWNGSDYLGIGQSAHGRLKTGSKIYALTHRRVMEELTAEERAEELILMGLRLNRGLDKKAFERQCGLAFDSFVNNKSLKNLTSLGLVINEKDNLRATDSGRLLLNKIISELCA